MKEFVLGEKVEGENGVVGVYESGGSKHNAADEEPFNYDAHAMLGCTTVNYGYSSRDLCNGGYCYGD